MRILAAILCCLVSSVSTSDAAVRSANLFFADRTPSLKSDVGAQTPQSAADTTSAVNYVATFEAWRERSRTDGFAAVEQELLSRFDRNSDTGANTDLPYFYFAHGLYPEALAAIEVFPENLRPAHLVILEGAAAVKMARWRYAVELLSSESVRATPEAAAWRGLAQYRLGAFKAAQKNLFERAGGTAPFEEQAASFFLAKAFLAIRSNDAVVARNALTQLRRRTITDRQRAERELAEARLMLLQNNSSAALNLLSDTAADAETAVALRAQIEILRLQVEQGELKPQGALIELERLSLQWRSAEFDRERLEFKAVLSDWIGDRASAILARRALLDKFPQADSARMASTQIQEMLHTIFSDKKLSPKEAAEIFYANIDLAPPGASGDALIRDAADTLIELDLLAEAGELLRHQVSNRLRGSEQARIAADLAEIYIMLGETTSALDILSSTRRTRLAEGVEQRRDLLKAKALYLSGDKTGALAILKTRSDSAGLILRADLLSSMDDHAGAGEAYAQAAMLGEGALSDKALSAALSAASAFVLVADEQSLQELELRVAPRIEDAAARDLFHAIAAGRIDGGRDGLLARYNEFFAG